MNRIETLQQVKVRTSSQQAESIKSSSSRVRRALSRYHARIHPHPFCAVKPEKTKGVKDVDTDSDVIDHYLDD